MSTVGGAHVIRVLVVDDEADHQVLVQAALSAARIAHFDLEFADRLDAALRRVAEGGIDLVLLDLGLPDARGLEGIVRLQADAPSVPIVVHTSSEDEVLARAAINMGAQDFVVKATLDPSALARALRYAIDRNDILNELKQRGQALVASANDTRRASQREHRSALRLHDLNPSGTRPL